MTMFKKNPKATKNVDKKTSKEDIDRLTIVVENGKTSIEGEISDHELVMFLMGGVPQMWKHLIENVHGNCTKILLTTFLISKLENLVNKLTNEDDSDDD